MVWPFRVINQTPGRRASAGRRGRLAIEALERRQLLAVDLSAYAVHRVVDNLSPAYTEAGSGWLGWSGSGAYQGDLRSVGAGTGQNTATFNLSDLDPAKTYQLFATWNESGAHASNTPFTVLDGGVALATVQLSQQAAPSEATLDGQNWQSLGVFHASTGTLNVRISDAANGSVVADAVCIVQIAPLTLYWDADGAASNNVTGSVRAWVAVAPGPSAVGTAGMTRSPARTSLGSTAPRPCSRGRPGR